MDQEYIEIVKTIINNKLTEQGKKNIVNKEMTLNAEEKIAIQQIIASHIKESGLAIVEALGQEQVLGMISSKEIEYLDNLVKDYKAKEERVSQLS